MTALGELTLMMRPHRRSSMPRTTAAHAVEGAVEIDVQDLVPPWRGRVISDVRVARRCRRC